MLHQSRSGKYTILYFKRLVSFVSITQQIVISIQKYLDKLCRNKPEIHSSYTFPKLFILWGILGFFKLSCIYSSFVQFLIASVIIDFQLHDIF